MNTYASLAFADQYFQHRGRPTWAALADENERKAFLIQATDAINTGSYRGRQVAGQFNKFPRAENGGVIPEEVQRACAEEAYARGCDADAAERNKRRADGIAGESIGGASVSYDSKAQRADSQLSALWSDEAKALLRPWLLGSAVIA